jgi:hypothetical protein
MIVEPVPLQNKVAELEQRIEKLEKERAVTTTNTSTERTVYVSGRVPDGIFGDGWKKMWQGFDEMMKAAFR